MLDGSDPRNEWVEAEGTRDPGLVPYDEQPKTTRDDYVFNANDSFWLPHASEILAGDYSPLHGDQATPRSPRTRENAAVLDDTSAGGASGDDGAFDLDELADAALANRGYMARELRADVVERCQGADPVEVNAEAPEEGSDTDPLPAAAVDIGLACEGLADWDGVYDLDRSGPALWRELMSRYSDEERRTTVQPLWGAPFDPAEPSTTPSGLAADPSGPGEADPLLVNLARAVQTLEVAGFAPDVALGDIQFALRAGERIPIHGGTGTDGTTNIVGSGGDPSILDPAFDGPGPTDIVDGSSLARIDDEVGYPVSNGTSFLMALAFTEDGPQARAFLTYGDTENRSDDLYTEATQRFSDKDWRTVAFTEDQIDEQAIDTMTVRG